MVSLTIKSFSLGSVCQAEAKPTSSEDKQRTSFGLEVIVQEMSVCQWLHRQQHIKGRLWKVERCHNPTRCLSKHGQRLTPLAQPFKARPWGHTGETAGAKALRKPLPSCLPSPSSSKRLQPALFALSRTIWLRESNREDQNHTYSPGTNSREEGINIDRWISTYKEQ